MRCAVSNIAWGEQEDEQMLLFLKEQGFEGLEIAPTRLFPDRPYEQKEAAARFAGELLERYGLAIPSMQSIWYGRQEKLFGSAGERHALLAYTKQAVDFAAACGCRNLVFGCPKNRLRPDGAPEETALEFFREIGAYGAQRGVVLGLEANPPIYGTNFMNATRDAFEVARRCASPGVGVNLDMGTVIAGEEELCLPPEDVALISHVHISEPGLAPVEKRPLHQTLARQLQAGGYRGFVSLEMGAGAGLRQVQACAAYIKEVFA